MSVGQLFLISKCQARARQTVSLRGSLDACRIVDTPTGLGLDILLLGGSPAMKISSRNRFVSSCLNPVYLLTTANRLHAFGIHQRQDWSLLSDTSSEIVCEPGDCGVA
jgi:hypothetical protein